jgi:carbon monoxide dehydrogenase subunit G
MEVRIDKRYPLQVDPERAWALLGDIRAVAGCMPGAQITEQVSETSYKGVMKVKVGPAQAQFGGSVEVLELDAGARRMSLRGKGADKGGSTASMELHAALEPDPGDPGQVMLHGDACVEVTGKFAQFGARMMVQVSELLLAQFVAHFQTAARQLPTAGTAQAPGAQPGGADTDSAQAHAPASPAGVGAAPQASAAPRAAAGELNGLAILWALIKSWFAGLFGRRTR